MSQKTSIPLFSVAGKQYRVVVEARDDRVLSYNLESDSTAVSDDVDKNGLLFGADIVVLDSVNSGTGRTKLGDFCRNIIEPVFKELHLESRTIRTQSPDSVTQLARTFKTTAKTTIVLFLSGDTTISEFLNNLPQGSAGGLTGKSSVVLLPLPFGSGNAWATSLQILCPVTAFRNLLHNNLKPTRFPLYRATFPNSYEIVFFIIFSVGFHANLLHLCQEPRFDNLGVEKFQLAAQEILDTYRLDYSFHIPTKTTPVQLAYFALINTPNLEKTYKPSPMSDPLKQQLHLLGYSATLKQPDLVARIMKGYENKTGDDISGDGVLYEALESDFSITLRDTPESSSRTAFDICCDGHLLNMLQLQVKGAPFDGKISIKFINDYSDLDLQVLVPSS
ncbi:LADA_0D01046g1_1 [Lachancea dasiensis]|uniref:LADA_0D01046g1_1 n=1 Tax=Lachancea dasiensis TaxID=1072105 RepID=A0A1G4J3K7_9SACH|nr:LADA_0D01046g1_1 [Lachancea dasiensis]